MHQHYKDILDRIDEAPTWFDDYGVPRFGDFSPSRLGNIYAYEAALAAERALKIDWTKAPADNFDSDLALEEHAAVARDIGKPGFPAHKNGDISSIFTGAAKVLPRSVDFRTTMRSTIGRASHTVPSAANAGVAVNASGAWPGLPCWCCAAAGAATRRSAVRMGNGRIRTSLSSLRWRSAACPAGESRWR